MATAAGEPDVRLHDRLVAGDDDALAEIYDLWSTLVYSVAARITGDRTGAEDITQEVFVHLWEKPQAFDPGRGSLRTWLCVVARGRSLDWVRRTSARIRYQTAWSAERATSTDVDDAMLQQTEAKAVREGVRSLPPAQRDAVMLAFFHERTYREVARELNIPEGTAKSRLRSGLSTLADYLAAEGIAER